MLATLVAVVASFVSRRAPVAPVAPASGELTLASEPETHAERIARIQARCEAFKAAHPVPEPPARGKNYIRPEHRRSRKAPPDWRLIEGAERPRSAR